MTARPMTFGPITWTVFVIGLAVVLAHLPLVISYVLGGLSVTGLVRLADENYRAKADRIREALSILRIPITTAAKQYMAMDPSDFERALSGERKLDDWRLEMLGPEFQRVLALLTLRDLGLPELARTALKIQPTLEQMKESA